MSIDQFIYLGELSVLGYLYEMAPSFTALYFQK